MPPFTQSQQPEKRKVFISFHHADEWYRNEFNRLWGDQFIGTDVKLGDIDTENSEDYTKRLIQVDHIVNSSVVVALYGTHTRKRKHVDWGTIASIPCSLKSGIRNLAAFSVSMSTIGFLLLIFL